jgi:hypothetical protein
MMYYLQKGFAVNERWVIDVIVRKNRTTENAMVRKELTDEIARAWSKTSKP